MAQEALSEYETSQINDTIMTDEIFKKIKDIIN